MKNKKLVPNKNNSTTFLPIFTGFYGSIWDEPSFEGEAKHFGLKDNFPFWEYVNWSEYYEALAKSFCNTVEKEMSDFVERIDYVKILSPKEYNFVNDRIECIIRPNKKAIAKYLNENEKAFAQYLIDHFKSRDGFISFYAYDINTWKNEYTKGYKDFSGDFNHLGSILNFIAQNEKIDEDRDILYYGSDNINVTEFYTEAFYKIVDGTEEVKKWVKENYQHENVRELAMQKFTESDDNEFNEHFDVSKVKDAINEAINEIEEQTIKMIF